jgi:hypothetical protein
MGLFTANPEPVIEEEPLLHTRPTPGYKSGGSRIKTTEAGAVKPFKANALGRGGTVFQVRPAQFIGVPLTSTLKKTVVCRMHTLQNRQYTAAGGNSPEMPTDDRYRIQPQILATGENTPAA